MQHEQVLNKQIRTFFGNISQPEFVHADRLCNLACSEPNLDICNVANLPGSPIKDGSKMYAMNWRFFPTVDPQVKPY